MPIMATLLSAKLSGKRKATLHRNKWNDNSVYFGQIPDHDKKDIILNSLTTCSASQFCKHVPSSDFTIGFSH